MTAKRIRESERKKIAEIRLLRARKKFLAYEKEKQREEKKEKKR